MAEVDYQAYEKPGFLAPGKFQRYASLLFTHGTWRIGTEPDGSCFFHALLTATDKAYRSIAKRKGQGDERCDIAKALRKNLSKKLTIPVWNSLQGGVPRHFAMTLSLRHVESVVTECIKNPSSRGAHPWVLASFSGNVEALELVSEVIQGELFDVGAFSASCKKGEGYMDVAECDKKFCKHQVSRYVKLLSDDIKSLVAAHGSNLVEASGEGFAILVRNVARRARDLAFQKVQSHFGDSGQWIGTEFLPFISEQFNMNIFIISGETGLPYLQAAKKEDYSSDRGTIFLLAVDDTHYECLGFEVKDSESTKAKVRCKVTWTTLM